MVCEMLTEVICKTMPGFSLAGHAATSSEGLALCRRVKPELALIDVRIPGKDGIETAQILLEELPETRVIIISGECSPYNCYRISTSGIHGFIDKTRPITELCEAVKTVMKGGVWFSPSYEKMRREFGKNPDAFFKILSVRELEVLRRVACGDSDDEIARQLNISRRTAETHRYNITKKLGLSDTFALRKYAIQLGMWCFDQDSTS